MVYAPVDPLWVRPTLDSPEPGCSALLLPLRLHGLQLCPEALPLRVTCTKYRVRNCFAGTQPKAGGDNRGPKKQPLRKLGFEGWVRAQAKAMKFQ